MAVDSNDGMKYIQNWSGGKDSTASIILEHVHGMPPSDIIFSEVMFDKSRGISGELPEPIDFIRNTAIPILENWGYKIDIVHAKRDFVDMFHTKITRSKIPDRNGKIYGFPIGGACYVNSRCKIPPIREYERKFPKDKLIRYVGIAADERDRLKRLEGTNKISLLERFGYTESMAFDLCKKYGLLSPIYNNSGRGGCWFCPNSSIREFARLKLAHPELWDELERLSREPNCVSGCFKRQKSFGDVDREVDEFIENGDIL